MRTIITLLAKQKKALDEICRREKISRAEAIRRAIDRYTESRRASGKKSGAVAFGLWRDRKEDALEYERRLRKEWESDESGT